MKLTRLAAIPAALCLLLSASCIKEEHNPYDMNIKGVDLRTFDANPAGIIGSPDVHIEDGNFFMSVYPKPAMMNFSILFKNPGQAVQVRLKLISVLYAEAPVTIIIENKPLVGTCLRDVSFTLPATGSMPGSGFTYSMDISKLPQGFYRLYAETDKGAVYWDNIWLMR